MIKEYLGDLKKEFKGYGKRAFIADMLAGITVAAVSLPLALAFGVSSGADAAAGLITAVVASFLIGGLSGASFQISGPTGAMAAILIPLATRYGITTVLAAGFLSGIIRVIAGVFKLGKLISFIPKSVITGFTSGIAIIIALGQVENFLGVSSYGDKSYMRIYNLFVDAPMPNFWAIGIALSVMVLMFAWPKKWRKWVPASLLAVIVTTVIQIIAKLPVNTVGTIPRTIIHDARLSFSGFFDIEFSAIILPGISIAMLGMIESLLCGTVAGKMKKEKFDANRELIAQGIGNMVLPFMGGVPATAAIARTSVAIKSGGRTRITGMIQGVILLLSIFLLSSFMSKVPMATLAGILMVTAWRTNEWHSIKYIFNKKFKTEIAAFLITLLCTVIFDLAVAIAVGCLFSLLLHAVRDSSLEVIISEFDPKRAGNINISKRVQIVYVSGSIFFGSSAHFAKDIKEAVGDVILFSMRGVPNMDISGVQELQEFCEEVKKDGKMVLFCGIQPKVKKMLDRSGVTEIVGENVFFWDAITALHSIESNEPENNYAQSNKTGEAAEAIEVMENARTAE